MIWPPRELGNNASLFPVLAIVQSLSFCPFVHPDVPSVTAAYFWPTLAILGPKIDHAVLIFKNGSLDDSLIDYIDAATLIIFFPDQPHEKFPPACISFRQPCIAAPILFLPHIIRLSTKMPAAKIK